MFRHSLTPVLREAAVQLSRHARLFDEDSDDERGVYGSTWVLISDDAKTFERPPLESDKVVRLWTDDYSDLWRILK